MTADEIVAAARECLDTPFHHQGRIVGLALDCAGVAVHVASKWYEVEEPPAYGRLPHDAMLEQWIERQPFLERAAIPQAGDLLLMRFKGEPQHLAIHAGDLMIHAYQEFEKTVEHNLDDKWCRRIVRAYRFKGISQGIPSLRDIA